VALPSAGAVPRYAYYLAAQRIPLALDDNMSLTRRDLLHAVPTSVQLDRRVARLKMKLHVGRLFRNQQGRAGDDTDPAADVIRFYGCCQPGRRHSSPGTSIASASGLA
jgi:hypothetical protein